MSSPMLHLPALYILIVTLTFSSLDDFLELDVFNTTIRSKAKNKDLTSHNLK